MRTANRSCPSSLIHRRHASLSIGDVARPMQKESSIAQPPLGPHCEQSVGKWKRLIFRLILLSVSLAVSLVAFEIALRLTGMDDEPAVYRPHLVQSMTTSEYAFTAKINSLGLRDVEYAVAKPPGTFRILVLGDSFIFGQGVELHETCCKVLEQELNSGQQPPRYEVINLGKISHGPETYLRILGSLGRTLKPDLVLIAFTVGNDINDVRYCTSMRAVAAQRSWLKSLAHGALPKSYMFFLRRYYALRQRQPLKNEIGKRIPSGAPNPLNEELLIARAGAEGISPETMKARIAAVAPELWRDALELRVNPFLLRDALIRPQVVRETLLLESDEMKKAWEATKGILREIFEAAQAIPSRVAVVAIPASQQVSRSYWAYREMLGYELDERLLSEARIQDALRAFCNECAVPLMDPLPTFRKSSSARLYYPKDEHWTAEGHRLAASEMRTFLTSQKLIPVN